MRLRSNTGAGQPVALIMTRMATALAKTGGEKVGFIENTAMRHRGGPFKKNKKRYSAKFETKYLSLMSTPVAVVGEERHTQLHDAV